MKWILLMLALLPASALATIIQFSGLYGVTDLHTNERVYDLTVNFKFDSDLQQFYDWNAYTDSGAVGTNGVSNFQWSEYGDTWYGYSNVIFTEGLVLYFYQVDVAGVGSYASPWDAVAAGEWVWAVFVTPATSAEYFGAQIGDMSQTVISTVPEPATLSLLALGLAALAWRRRTR